MPRLAVGTTLVTLSFLVFIAERSTFAISAWLARAWCGERYLQPVEGIMGEISCGFDADMYLAVVLLLPALAGIGMLLSTGRFTSNRGSS